MLREGVFLALVLSDYLSPCMAWRLALSLAFLKHFSGASSFVLVDYYTLEESWAVTRWGYISARVDDDSWKQ